MKQLINISYKYIICVSALVGLSFFSSCKKFLDTKLNSSEITSDKVFDTDFNAIAAVTGMYSTMRSSGFAAGGYDGVGGLTGLSGDELANIFRDQDFLSFENNALLADNFKVLNLWNSAYKLIYSANDILESLENSTAITPELKKQLQGEAFFIRAFCHFYLVNIFGDIPVVTQTNYSANSIVKRVAVAEVYDQIKNDLVEAQSLMKDDYPETERVRPNKFTATALLARVYLFIEDYENAIIQSTQVLDHNGYLLETDLNTVFTPSSREVIWQISTESQLPTTDGVTFVIAYGPGYGSSVINNNLLATFDNSDARKSNWIGTYNDGTADLFFPYKYKQFEFGTTVVEHFVVLRLAEQLLIRAEALTKQGNPEAAITDLDKIRERAGISLIVDTNPSISEEDLLLAIENERWKELFTEWGHRWFDLKRTNRAIPVLSLTKPGITADDLLYPVPQDELNRNPEMGDQNPGY